MTLEEIRELLKFVTETGVAELEVQRDSSRVRIRRVLPGARTETVLSAPTAYVPPAEHHTISPAHSPAAHAPASLSSAVTQPISEEDELLNDPSIVIVRSPIVGTFYEGPAPGAAPFVAVGETVRPGQVLCIIESMKLMNEIECEAAGQIVKRFAANAQPVEYGEALFAVKPA